jgi:prepilin-type N-terminal cleavage/methylation domain-containing protein
MIRNPRTDGFTLVELMFSIAVGTVILLAAVAFLGSSADGYARVGGSISTERENRMLLGEIASELASAVFHEDMRWERTDGGWPSAHIGFLTLRPADAQSVDKQIGDLCAVHYYLGDLTIGGRVVRCVMRGSRDSKPTFDALRGHALDGLFAPDEMADEPIALRVVSFDAQALVMGVDGTWTAAPLPLAAAPEAVRIRLVIVRPPLAARLVTAADWDGATALAARELGPPAEIRRNKHLQVFECTLPFGRNEVR